jgi:hypothetical protein
LNALLKDLEIPVKSYIVEIPWNNNDSIISNVLYFQSFKEVCKRKDNRERPPDILTQ